MIYLVIIYSAAGRMQEAGEMVAKLRAVVPGYRIWMAQRFQTGPVRGNRLFFCRGAR